MLDHSDPRWLAIKADFENHRNKSKLGDFTMLEVDDVLSQQLENTRRDRGYFTIEQQFLKALSRVWANLYGRGERATRSMVEFENVLASVPQSTIANPPTTSQQQTLQPVVSLKFGATPSTPAPSVPTFDIVAILQNLSGWTPETLVAFQNFQLLAQQAVNPTPSPNPLAGAGSSTSPAAEASPQTSAPVDPTSSNPVATGGAAPTFDFGFEAESRGYKLVDQTVIDLGLVAQQYLGANANRQDLQNIIAMYNQQQEQRLRITELSSDAGTQEDIEGHVSDAGEEEEEEEENREEENGEGEIGEDVVLYGKRP